jgi:F-type H+-transporting ATPase subunit a
MTHPQNEITLIDQQTDISTGTHSTVLEEVSHGASTSTTSSGSHESAHTDEHSAHTLDKTPTIFAEPIIRTPFLEINNSLFSSWIVVIIIVLIVSVLKIKKIPRRFQSFFEFVIEGGLSLCDQVTNNRSLSKKIFPLAFSVFLFILLNNWLALLPLTSIGLIQVHEGHEMFVPFIRGGTADINTTLALGVMAVIGANIFGIAAIGGWKTLNKYVNIRAVSKATKHVKKEPTGIVVALIKFFVGVLEFIGEIAKVASLSFRLFGNVFAGEVLLVSMSVLMAYVVPIPFLFLEVLVGVVQAVIFSMLTLVYFTIASHDHDEEHADDHQHKIHAEVVHPKNT